MSSSRIDNSGQYKSESALLVGNTISTGGGDIHFHASSDNVRDTTGTILSSRTDFAGSYAHSSLHPVSLYVPRPQLELLLQAQFPTTQDRWTVNETRTAFVWGLGGAGKSQLVLNYVRAQQKRYQAVFWVEAGQKKTVQRDYVQIYKQLYRDMGKDGVTVPVEDAVTGVKSWLQQQEQRCLWVMDSADDIDDQESESFIDLHHYLPDSPRLDRIITTRSSRVGGMATESSIAVGDMDIGEAAQLFKKSARIQNSSEETQNEIQAIVEELGCLALAVTLAGSYVRETPGSSSDLSRFQTEYKSNRVRLLSQQPHPLVHQYGESVLGTWELSIRAIRQQSPIAANLMCLLAFLNFDDIFLSLFTAKPASKSISASKVPSPRVRFRDRFRQLLTKEPSSSSPPSARSKSPESNEWRRLLSPAQTPIDLDEITSAFKVLQAYSLVSWQADREAFSMHKLVHAWGHDRLALEQQQVWSSAVLGLLINTLHQHRGDKKIESRLIPHIMANFAAISLAQHLPHSMTVRDQNHLETIEEFLYSLGRWDDVHKVCTLLLRLHKKAHGQEDPSTLDSMNNLAVVLERQGKIPQAEEMHSQTLRLRDKVLGREHPDTLTSLNNLALVLEQQGKYQQAEVMHSETLRLKKKVLGREHPDTLASMNNLAVVLQRQGKYQQAEVMHSETLRLKKKVLGREHTGTLPSMNNLAVVLERQGKYQQAEEMHSQTLRLWEKALGREHPSTLTSMNNLAIALEQQGKYRQAEELLSETVQLSEKVLGREHPDTLSSLNNLAAVLGERGRYQQAEELLSDTVQLREKVLGRNHPDTLGSVRNLATLFRQQSKDEQANRILQSYDCK